MKTRELIGVALDWAVAECEGFTANIWHGKVFVETPGIDSEEFYGWTRFEPTVNWSQGGPIIEREFLELRPGSFIGSKESPRLWAAWGQNRHGDRQQGKNGLTPLIAAMRTYVASKLGDEVDVPEELK
jgi:hypothetical protein